MWLFQRDGHSLGYSQGDVKAASQFKAGQFLLSSHYAGSQTSENKSEEFQQLAQKVGNADLWSDSESQAPPGDSRHSADGFQWVLQ